jgi:hypothetical protein
MTSGYRALWEGGEMAITLHVYSHLVEILVDTW